MHCATDQFPTLGSFEFAEIGQSQTHLEVLCFTSEDGLFEKEFFEIDQFIFNPTDDMKKILDFAFVSAIHF